MSTDTWPDYLGARARRALEAEGIAPNEAHKLRTLGPAALLRHPNCGQAQHHRNREMVPGKPWGSA